MFREASGAAGLAGRDMPTDQALAAHASVCARAVEYKESGAFPDGTRMDQYRVAAYLDLLNGITAGARIATGLLPGARPAGDPPAGQAPGRSDCACRQCDGSCRHPAAGRGRRAGGGPDGSDPDAGPPGAKGPPTVLRAARPDGPGG